MVERVCVFCFGLVFFFFFPKVSVYFSNLINFLCDFSYYNINFYLLNNKSNS